MISAQVSPDLVARSNNSTPMKCRTLELICGTTLEIDQCKFMCMYINISIYIYPYTLFLVNRVSHSSRGDTFSFYRQVRYEEMHLVSKHFWKPCVVDDSVTTNGIWEAAKKKCDKCVSLANMFFAAQPVGVLPVSDIARPNISRVSLMDWSRFSQGTIVPHWTSALAR